MLSQRPLPPMIRHLFANAGISTRSIVVDQSFREQVDAELQKFLEEEARKKTASDETEVRGA